MNAVLFSDRNSIGSAGEFTSPAHEDSTVTDLQITETTSGEASETIAMAQTTSTTDWSEPLDTEQMLYYKYS